MIEPIFEGARSRCRRHSERLLAPKEIECDECKTIRRNLGIQPPFSVRCDRTHFEVKQGEVYTVVWVIHRGSRQHFDKMFGYVFKDTDGNLVDRIFSPVDFTPVAFLSHEEKEKLKVPEEKQEVKQADEDEWDAWYCM